MIVGCPKEVKPQEGRVGLLPAGAAELVRNKHKVLIQKGAGELAGAPDEQYSLAGAELVETAAEVFARADLIVKVKEPQPEEYVHVRGGQVVFTYFHFASSRSLTEAMLQSQAVCIAYETVEEPGRRLVLLEPMSEVAGRMAILEGLHHLRSCSGGKGVLLGGVPGVPRGKVLILGGGVVGLNAAKAAAGIGATVVIMDCNFTRLRFLDDILPRNCTTRYFSEAALVQELGDADLVVGAVLLAGCKAPKLLRREHLKRMQRGSLVVDVAVDHGGCCETSRGTSHAAPTFEVEGILHYGVANMPGAVPVTATAALASATLPYVLQIANFGWAEACSRCEALRKGLSVARGRVLHAGVAATFNFPVSSFEDVSAAQSNPTTRFPPAFRGFTNADPRRAAPAFRESIRSAASSSSEKANKSFSKAFRYLFPAASTAAKSFGRSVPELNCAAAAPF